MVTDLGYQRQKPHFSSFSTHFLNDSIIFPLFDAFHIQKLSDMAKSS